MQWGQLSIVGTAEHSGDNQAQWGQLSAEQKDGRTAECRGEGGQLSAFGQLSDGVDHAEAASNTHAQCTLSIVVL